MVRSIWPCVAVVALLALGLCGAGVFALVGVLPPQARREAEAANRVYRAWAREILASPERYPTLVGPRPAGWEGRGKVGRKGERPCPFGLYVTPEGCRVWVEVGGAVRFDETVRTPVPETNWALCRGLVVLAMAGVLALAAFSVWFAQRVLRARDDFLAATAHDLTTPLVGLRGLIGRSDDEARLLNERMLRLVGNLKDFLKLGGRRRPPVFEVFPLAEAFAEAYRVFAADYAEEASGEVTLAGDAALCVSADRTLTVQILWNLLGNDLKYAAPWGRVWARLSATDGDVTLELLDEGPGMTRWQRRRAFSRYYRVRTALSSGKGGFGIGLCNAREFAQAMGGRLAVEANDPRGCRFALTLRRA